MTERLREHGRWLTQSDIKARAFNKRCQLFLSGQYAPKYLKKKYRFKKMSAIAVKPKTQRIQLRPAGG